MTIRVNFYPFKILIKKSTTHLFKFSLIIYDTMHIWYVFFVVVANAHAPWGQLSFALQSYHILYKSAIYNFFWINRGRIACVIFFFYFNFNFYSNMKLHVWFIFQHQKKKNLLFKDLLETVFFLFLTYKSCGRW